MSKTVGEYVLKEKIGKGSYADVYKGTHKVTGLKYAIKAISKDILSEPKLLAGLESEIKIMREFSHENIVCLHEYFSSEKNFYLVLELCEGGDLSKFIRKKKRLDERLAHNFLAQITNGLAFLHDRGFIHRDLKPANVLLSEFSDNAVLKLADFGFARQLAVASLAQTRCGTPLYMASRRFFCVFIDLCTDFCRSLSRRLKYSSRRTTTERLMSGASAAYFMRCLSERVRSRVRMKATF
jgi:serine/threonine-protein kinase ULK/ATG1